MDQSRTGDDDIRRFGDALDPQGQVAYQTALAGEFTSQWFDPRYWARSGALLGGIDGVAGTWLVRDGRRCLQLRRLRQPHLPAAVAVDRFVWLGEARCRAWQQLQASVAAQAAGLCRAPVIAVRWRRQGWFYSADVLSVHLDSLPTLAQQLAAGAVTLEVWAAAGRCLRRHHDAGISLPAASATTLRIGGPEGVQVGDYHRARSAVSGMRAAADLVNLRRSLERIADDAGHGVDDVSWHCLLAAYG